MDTASKQGCSLVLQGRAGNVPSALLAAAQGGSVVLATLSFTGIAAGLSLVGVTGPASDPFFSLVGRDFAELPVAFNTPALAGIYAVPEPGPLALVGFALIALVASASVRRRSLRTNSSRHDDG